MKRNQTISFFVVSTLALISTLLTVSWIGWNNSNRLNRDLTKANSEIETTLEREKQANRIVKANLHASNEMAGDFSKIISKHIDDHPGQQNLGQELVDVLTRFSEVLEAPSDDSEIESTLASSHLMAGESLFRLGRLDLALSELKKAEARVRESSSVELANLCAKIRNQQAKILAMRGQSVEAVVVFEVAIKELSESEDPSIPILLNLKNGLANEYARKDVNKAFELMKTVVEDARTLFNADPIKHCHALGDSLNDFGVLNLRMKLWPGAKSAFREAISVYEKALENEPSSNKYREYLAGTIGNLSWAVKEADKLPLRERSFQLFSSLVKDNPDVPRYQKNMVDAGQNLVVKFLFNKEFDRCTAIMRKTKPVAIKLREDSPNVLEYQEAFIGVLNAEMELCEAQSDFVLAESLGAEIIGEWKQVCKVEPEDLSYRSSLARSYINLAEVLIESGKEELAESHLQEAKSLSKTISVPRFDKHRNRLNELLNRTVEKSK